MSLIAIFTAPKPFTNPHIAVIQRNAIQSWLHLPDVEIFLIGEESGLARVAEEFGVRHLPNVARNTNGTPLIRSMFDLVRRNSRSPLLCIVNTDILLMSDLVTAVRQVAAKRERFVLLGRRWDLDMKEPFDFSSDWESRLQARASKHGRLHKPAGSDYFVFPRFCYSEVPDFAIGRAGWDNWMIYKAHKEKWPLIDTTDSVMIIHQNHDYSHLPGGQPHYTLPETDENIRLAGGTTVIRYSILDATAKLVNGKIRPPSLTWGRLLRIIERWMRAVFGPVLPENTLEAVVRPRRWYKRAKRFLRK